jgi:hypothetical protein
MGIPGIARWRADWRPVRFGTFDALVFLDMAGDFRAITQIDADSEIEKKSARICVNLRIKPSYLGR